jgi:sugar O-acyltransferase (sialic acid O-acetyltransferase NeuD family)
MKVRLILIGGGGHCHACIDVIESTEKFDIIGIIDKREKVGQLVLGYPIIGDDSELYKFIKEDTWFIITLGNIKNANLRKSLFQILENYQANIATIISPYALVSKHSNIESGTIIMHRAIVGANSKIGHNSIINTNSNVEHDCIIGNHTHISTHAIINGHCVIGNEVFIGSNGTVFQEVSIVNNVTIGAGSLVTKNIKTTGVYFGNPVIQH